MTAFNGLGMSLGNLSRLSGARTRSISPENPAGRKGEGGRSRTHFPNRRCLSKIRVETRKE